MMSGISQGVSAETDALKQADLAVDVSVHCRGTGLGGP